MNEFSSIKSDKNSPHPFKSSLKLYILLLFILFVGCSSTKRFSSDTNNNFDSNYSIRVLLNNKPDEVISVDDLILISDDTNVLAEVNSGNKLKFSLKSGKINLSIGSKQFDSNVFYINAGGKNGIIKINNKKYRGRILASIYNSELKIVNQVRLEDYVKGVMIKEMPIGKENENYNALKAFSICVRTYAFNKIEEGKEYFDIYPDTRDQVYGGVEGETEMTNNIVDETLGQLLFYDDELATIFYHSTCGGYAEDVVNVFSKNVIPYLNGEKDGDEPFCKISPRYEWTENYAQSVFINRLFNAKLIENENYSISNVSVDSRFESGRVNELVITLNNNHGDEKSFSLFGNSMRAIIRNGDGKSILKSTLFDLQIDEYKNIIITGKGSGHGVGLCQWGAIGQSRKNIDYKKILNHYFPGTEIKKVYD